MAAAHLKAPQASALTRQAAPVRNCELREKFTATAAKQYAGRSRRGGVYRCRACGFWHARTLEGSDRDRPT